MASAATTTWRSPFSILVGARRNDDEDLELRVDDRHDRLLPRSPMMTTTTTTTGGEVASPNSTAAIEDDCGGDDDDERRSSSSRSHGLLASYVPFGRYFGLGPSPAYVESTTNHRTTALPPRGAFPPPVSSGGGGSSSSAAPAAAVAFPPRRRRDGTTNGGGGGGLDDDDDYAAAISDRRRGNRRRDGTTNGGGGGGGGGDDDDYEDDDDDRYVASHPWFHRLTPSDFHYDDENENENANNDPSRRGPTTIGGRRSSEFETRSRESHTAEDVIISGKEERTTPAMMICGTTVNFANSIIGAGAMGLGGAFASSGGMISVLSLFVFALLTKTSLDLVIDMSDDYCNNNRTSSILLLSDGEKEEDDGSRRDDDRDHDDDHRRDGIVSVSGLESFLRCDRDYLEKRGGEGEGADDVEEDEPDDAPPTTIENEGIIAAKRDDDVDGGGGSTREEEMVGSTPLMARDEGNDDDDDVGNALRSPTETTGLLLDHPLASSTPQPNDNIHRYDSFTMDVTQPRYFSPLHIMETIDASNDNIVLATSFVNTDPLRKSCTYEELGRAAFGSTGRLAVLMSKSLYSGGCLIAYVVVVRDNFGLALRRIAIGPSTSNPPSEDEGHGWLYDDDFLAFWVSAIFMLPLSCPRTMKPLAKFSFVSILSIVFLILAVVYLYFACTNPRGGGDNSSFYENWIEIRSFSGYVESLGCFVFTFVSHHTVHLAYESLPPPVRNPKIWRKVSTNAIAVALEASLAIGVFAYLTFGSMTPADVLMGYPADITLANIARLLLCLSMILTFPLPFLTCREMTILLLVDVHEFYHRRGLGRFNVCRPMWKAVWRCIICKGKQRRQTYPTEGELDDPDAAGDFVPMKRLSFFERWRRKSAGIVANEEWWDDINGNGGPLTQALLVEDRESDAVASIGGQKGKEINPSPLSSRSGDPSSSESTVSSTLVPPPSWILPNSDGRQLSFLWHAALTFAIWLIVTVSAIKSPSLIDVLDLVGAFTGTMLAFILPALFSFKLKGYSHVSLAILGIGGIVGLLGTGFSLAKLLRDTEDVI